MIFGKLSKAWSLVTKVDEDDLRLFFGRGSPLGMAVLMNGIRLPCWGKAERGTSMGIGGGGLSEDVGDESSEETEGS